MNGNEQLENDKNDYNDDDSDSNQESIIDYVASVPFGEEDDALLESLSLCSLLLLPWHVQFRVVAQLPSNDVRTRTLLPHIAAKVEQLDQDERDLVVVLNDNDVSWRQNILFYDWIKSRQRIMTQTLLQPTTTKNHQLRLWNKIIHGIDAILGSSSVDVAFPRPNPIYTESAKRQADVFRRWEGFRTTNIMAYLLSHATSIHLLCTKVGEMKCDALYQVYRDLLSVTGATPDEWKAAMTSIVLTGNDHTVGSTITKEGRARLVALIYSVMVQSQSFHEHPKGQYRNETTFVCLLWTGICLLIKVGFDLPNEIIQHMTSHWGDLQHIDIVRRELQSCGHSLAHDEIERVTMSIRQPPKPIPFNGMTDLLPTNNKRRRESSAAVIDKLFGKKHEPSMTTSRRNSIAYSVEDNFKMENTVEKSIGTKDWTGDDNDDYQYDEEDEHILFL